MPMCISVLIISPKRSQSIRESCGQIFFNLSKSIIPIIEEEPDADAPLTDHADSPLGVDVRPYEIPLEPSTDEKTQPLLEEGHDKDRFSFTGFRKKDNWWSDQYKTARQFLYGSKTDPPDLNQAFILMQAEATKGNGLALYDLGRMYLLGLGCDKDESAASSLFQKALTAFEKMEKSAKNADYWQYRIGKLYWLLLQICSVKTSSAIRKP